MFQGPGLQILQTVALDLTFGQNVQFIIQFQLSKGRRENDDFKSMVKMCTCSVLLIKGFQSS